jgi:hypothetical protein
MQQTPEQPARFIRSYHLIGRARGWVQSEAKTSCSEVLLTLTQSEILRTLGAFFWWQQPFRGARNVAH